MVDGVTSRTGALEMECLGRNQRRDIENEPKRAADSSTISDLPRGRLPIPEYLLIQRRMVRGSTTSTGSSGQFVHHLVCLLYYCRQRNGETSLASVVGYTMRDGNLVRYLAPWVVQHFMLAIPPGRRREWTGLADLTS